MSNQNGRKAAAIITVSVLILLLIAAGAYLALQEVVGGFNVSSFFTTKESQQLEEIQASEQQQYDGYAFLNDNEKQTYAKIVRMLTDFESEVKVSGVNTVEVERVLSAVDYDHPEIFWAGEFSYYFDEKDQSVSRVMVEYPYDKAEKDRRQAEIDGAFQAYRTGVNNGMDDYDKVKYTYEYVIKNTVYREDLQDDQNIYSVFGKNGSVCAGYSKAIQYLLQRIGIECSYVAGEAIGQGAHAWNIVKVDGEYYYLDATWGEFNADDNSDPEKSIFYDYFCVTTDQLLKTHKIDESLIQYPQLTATAANYFVKENKLYDFSKQSEKHRFTADLETAIELGEKYFHYAVPDSSSAAVAEQLMDDVLGSYYWYSSGDGLSNTIQLY